MPKGVKNFEAPQEQEYNGAYDVWEFKIRFLFFFSWQVLQSAEKQSDIKEQNYIKLLYKINLKKKH